MSEYTMTSPCDNCPFRTDVEPYLRARRVSGIEGDLIDQQQSFICHKTTVSYDDDDGESHVVDGPKAQNCAGAMILLMKLDRPNQMMRIATRLGLLDPGKLDMSAPVFDSFLAMKKAQRDYEEPESASEPCSVVNAGCDAPAGRMAADGLQAGTENADYACSACCEPVCGTCSQMVQGERLCAYCAEETESTKADRQPLKAASEEVSL